MAELQREGAKLANHIKTYTVSSCAVICACSCLKRTTKRTTKAAAGGENPVNHVKKYSVSCAGYVLAFFV